MAPTSSSSSGFRVGASQMMMMPRRTAAHSSTPRVQGQAVLSSRSLALRTLRISKHAMRLGALSFVTIRRHRATRTSTLCTAPLTTSARIAAPALSVERARSTRRSTGSTSKETSATTARPVSTHSSVIAAGVSRRRTRRHPPDSSATEASTTSSSPPASALQRSTLSSATSMRR